MKKWLVATCAALFVLAGCDPTGVPDCDPDEELKWIPCGGWEPDTCGEWMCKPKPKSQNEA